MSGNFVTAVTHQTESITVTLVNQGSLSVTGNTGTGPSQPATPDSNYEHVQMSASATWTINHNLGKFPAVTVVDSAGNEVEGFVNHVTKNQATVTFSSAFAGSAICN